MKTVLQEFVLKLTGKGFSPREIAEFWYPGNGVNHSGKIYEVLRKYGVNPKTNDLTKVCRTKRCPGNDSYYHRRYKSEFMFCPFCTKKLWVSKAFKEKREAKTGELIE